MPDIASTSFTLMRPPTKRTRRPRAVVPNRGAPGLASVAAGRPPALCTIVHNAGTKRASPQHVAELGAEAVLDLLGETGTDPPEAPDQIGRLVG